MTLTIFTPTHNRAYILPNLYKSLIEQSNHNFEWLIVDDGSTDNTKEVIDGFKKVAKFPIIYIYQENQGKHIAINTALENIVTEYFVTVDSDDNLLFNAIEIIYNHLICFKEDHRIAAIAFPHKIKNLQNFQITKQLPYDKIQSNPYEMKKKYGIAGEFSLVFLTGIHMQYKYPQFKNEKFIKESVVYNRISNDYELLYINSAIVESEYLEDGLSNNFKKLLLNNPKGASLSHKEKMNNKFFDIKYRINEANAFWDYESLYNKSFINKLKKINGLFLKIKFLYSRIKRFIR